jgi:hypothetical protein
MISSIDLEKTTELGMKYQAGIDFLEAFTLRKLVFEASLSAFGLSPGLYSKHLLR